MRTASSGRGKKEAKEAKKTTLVKKGKFTPKEIFLAMKIGCPEVFFLMREAQISWKRIWPAQTIVPKHKCIIEAWTGRFYLDLIQWVVPVTHPTNYLLPTNSVVSRCCK